MTLVSIKLYQYSPLGFTSMNCVIVHLFIQSCSDNFRTLSCCLTKVVELEPPFKKLVMIDRAETKTLDATLPLMQIFRLFNWILPDKCARQ